MDPTEDPPVQLALVGKTALLTLNRPRRLNAIDAAMGEALQAALHTVRDAPAIHSLVLLGAGGDFCAGADLRAAPAAGDPAFRGRDTVLAFHRWFDLLAELEKPVIAAVDGVAAGAGLSLALAADFVLLTPRARLLAAFLRVGLVPDLSLLHVLPRLVGMARAKDIVLLGRTIPAEEALSMGLVRAVVPTASLRDEALALARHFDDAPLGALGLSKRLLAQSFETDRATLTQLEAAAQSICAASARHEEALRHFRAREPAGLSAGPAQPPAAR